MVSCDMMPLDYEGLINYMREVYNDELTSVEVRFIPLITHVANNVAYNVNIMLHGLRKNITFKLSILVAFKRIYNDNDDLIPRIVIKPGDQAAMDLLFILNTKEVDITQL